MAATQLGRVQLLIMQVLWDRGRATAREITETINASQPIAHSTVQTLLRGLEKKGSISHKVDERSFVFFPLVEQDKFVETATRDLIERVFGGSAGTLVTHLLKHENVSRKELDEIRKLIDRRAN